MGDPDVELANLLHQDSLRSHEEYLGSLPPGYRFCPEDKELLGYYLLNKVIQKPLRPNSIWDINIYRYDPDKLTGKLKRLRESEWYFFSSRHRKYPKGSRPDRGTPGGFWKPTGASELICDGRGVLIGYKRALDFYRGKQTDQSNSRSNWKMHEFVLPELLPKADGNSTAPSNNLDNMLLDDVILYKIYQKSNTEDHMPLFAPYSTPSVSAVTNFTPSTNISDLLYQESLPAPLVSELEGASFATTPNYNISDLPSCLYRDQSLHQTQYYGLGLDNVEEHMPLLVDNNDTNVNQLSSNRYHYPAPLEAGAVDSNTTPPAVYEHNEPTLDDDAYNNEL